MSRLKDQYNNEIKDAMQKKFGYKNVMEIPKLDKYASKLVFLAPSMAANMFCTDLTPNPGLLIHSDLC